MIALLSGIAGFLSSMAPEILALIRSNSDKKHEIEVMQKQAELGLQQARSEQLKAEAEADMRALEAAQRSYRAELGLAKDSWIAAFSASVRPVVTYTFFILYAAVKVKTILFVMGSMSMPALPWQIADALKLIWTDEDASLFSFIVCFWFGQRASKRGKNA